MFIAERSEIGAVSIRIALETLGSFPPRFQEVHNSPPNHLPDHPTHYSIQIHRGIPSPMWPHTRFLPTSAVRLCCCKLSTIAFRAA